MELWMPTQFAQDDYGNIVVIKGEKTYLDEAEAKSACAIGCKPVKLSLPEGYDIAPSWVIERGYDDCEFDDGRNPEFDWLEDLEERAAKGDEEAIYQLQNL